MKCAWIAGERSHTARILCRALQVSPSGYYAWRARRPSARTLDNQRLAKRIEQLHDETREPYSAERLWRGLRLQGEACGRDRVRRLRSEHAIQSRRRRR